jgi:hypothetical protein
MLLKFMPASCRVARDKGRSAAAWAPPIWSPDITTANEAELDAMLASVKID